MTGGVMELGMEGMTGISGSELDPFQKMLMQYVIRMAKKNNRSMENYICDFGVCFTREEREYIESAWDSL